MFNGTSASSFGIGSLYPARRDSQDGAAQINMGTHNIINHTFNVFSSNTTVTTKPPNRPPLPATPPPSLLYLRGTPQQQQYLRLPLLANSPQRNDSLPLTDDILVSPTVDNGRTPVHDSFLALTNRTDPSASQAVSNLVHDLAEKFVLMRTTQRTLPTSALAESQRRRDAVDLLIHLAKLATDSSRYPSGTDPIGVPKSIQEGVQDCIISCKDCLLSSRRSPDDYAVLMYFLGGMSEIELFRPPIQSVGVAVLHQAMETSSSVGLQHMVELLECFSNMTNLNFTKIVEPQELPLLYQHVAKHGMSQSIRGLLLNVLRERDYDEYSAPFLKEAVDYALEPSPDAQANRAILSVSQRLSETLAETGLERHRAILRSRRENMQGLAIAGPLLVVAQAVLMSVLLPIKYADLQRGHWTDTALTVSIVLAFAGLFLGLVVSLLVLSYNNTITRTVEGIQHIMDMKEQVDELLYTGGDLRLLDNRSSSKFFQQLSARIQGCIREAGRLDHITREHIHDGSRFTLLIASSAALFMTAILFATLATGNIQIWLPVAVLLGFALIYITVQELKHRPGAFKMAVHTVFNSSRKAPVVIPISPTPTMHFTTDA